MTDSIININIKMTDRSKKRVLRPGNNETSADTDPDPVDGGCETDEKERVGRRMENTTSPDPPPMTFRVQSTESRGGRRHSWPVIMIPMISILGLAFYFDPYIRKDSLWILAGMMIALYGFEIAQSLSRTTRTTELLLTISPLGIQRCRRRVTTTTSSGSETADSKKNKKQKIRMDYEPFVPIEDVHDCILVEHIETFQVSTHVMIRLEYGMASSDSRKRGERGGVVAAFPGARLTFEQCHTLQKQIMEAITSLRF